MAAAPGPASIPLWAESFSKHRTVKRKQTNEGFIDFPPLDSQAPAPLLLHITIVVFYTVTVWDPNPSVCPWMQHEKTANSVIFCQQLWKHPTFSNPIKIVLNTSTRCGGFVKHVLLTVGGLPQRSQRHPIRRNITLCLCYPPGPVTSPTANEGNISVSTQIMSSQGPKHKITHDNMKVL